MPDRTFPWETEWMRKKNSGYHRLQDEGLDVSLCDAEWNSEACSGRDSKP
jgi:hypothetical protein